MSRWLLVQILGGKYLGWRIGSFCSPEKNISHWNVIHWHSIYILVSCDLHIFNQLPCARTCLTRLRAKPNHWIKLHSLRLSFYSPLYPLQSTSPWIDIIGIKRKRKCKNYDYAVCINKLHPHKGNLEMRERDLQANTGSYFSCVFIVLLATSLYPKISYPPL